MNNPRSRGRALTAKAARRDDPQRAARNAFLIGADLMFRGETAPAMGWFARGGRVLEAATTAPNRLLPAYIEIMIASGDVASARAGVDELGQAAQLLDAPYLHAVAASGVNVGRI